MVFTVRFVLGIVLLLVTCLPLETATTWRQTRQAPLTENQKSVNQTLQNVEHTTSNLSDADASNNGRISTEKRNEKEIKPKTDLHSAESNDKNSNLNVATKKPHRGSTKYSATQENAQIYITSTIPFTTTETASHVTLKDHKNDIIKDAKEIVTTSRIGNSRSLDIDVDKYVSPEFHDKNNVFSIPTSPENKKYIHKDVDHLYTTSTFKFSENLDFNHDLTTPKSELFDSKHREFKKEVEQNLGAVENEFKIDDSEGSYEAHSKEVDVHDLIDKTKENGTNANLEYLEYQHVNINDSKKKNEKHKDVLSEKGLHVNFNSTFNDTKIVDEENIISISPPNEGSLEENEHSDSEKQEVVKDVTEISSSKIEVTDRGVKPTNVSRVDKPHFTKSPKVNETETGLLSNKIEADSTKSTQKIDNPETTESSKRPTASYGRRGSTKYASTITSSLEQTETPTTAALNKITKSSTTTEPSEQAVQENQIVPVKVLPPTTPNAIEDVNFVTNLYTTEITTKSLGVTEKSATFNEVIKVKSTPRSHQNQIVERHTTSTTTNPSLLDEITTESNMFSTMDTTFSSAKETIETTTVKNNESINITTLEIITTTSIPEAITETIKLSTKMNTIIESTTNNKVNETFDNETAETSSTVEQETTTPYFENNVTSTFESVSETITEQTNVNTSNIITTSPIPNETNSTETTEKYKNVTESLTTTSITPKTVSDVSTISSTSSEDTEPQTTETTIPETTHKGSNSTELPDFISDATSKSNHEYSTEISVQKVRDQTSTEDNTDDSTAESIEHGADDSDNSGTLIAIIISCVGALCLILLVGLLIVMRKRQKRFNYPQMCKPVDLDSYNMDNVSVYNSVRRKGTARTSKRSYGNPAFDDPTSISRLLNFQGLVKFTNPEEMKTEFDEIPQVTARMNELPDGCEVKNRYANVIPLPETRVFLKEIEGYPNSDYVNANYVTGAKGTKGCYIACQAPMSNTVDDFWRMVWEQQSKVILMLTHLYENGVEKCTDYLPPSEVVDCHRLFGDFQVTLKKRDVKDKYIISSLQLKNMVSNSWREVTHLWYLGWPEKGIPSEANSLIAFLIEARSYIKNTANGNTGEASNGNVNKTSGKPNSSPVVVHCSPGTGRTGTVIACDIAIREFELSRQVDIPRIVYRIRRDRASSVQTKEQYVFIYKVITLYATKLTGGALDSL